MTRNHWASLKDAMKEFSSGLPIAIYGEIENETDVIIQANYVTPKQIREMRLLAGGLISLIISNKLANELGIILEKDLLIKSNYDTLSNLANKPFKRNSPEIVPRFSVSIDYIKTLTGISDNDRSETISKFVQLINSYYVHKINKDKLREHFTTSFISPGHIRLIIASKDLLASRKGHSELSIAICEIIGVVPVVVLCEVINSKDYNSCSLNEVINILREASIPIISSSQIMREWEKQKR